MTADSGTVGSSLLKKLLLLLVLAGLAYFLITLLGEDSGSLQTYDGFN